MKAKKCGKCALINFANMDNCERCGEALPDETKVQPPRPLKSGSTLAGNVAAAIYHDPQPTIPTVQVVQPTSVLGDKPLTQISAGDVLSIVVWIFAVGAFGLCFISLTSDLDRATSAPQQAAAAAINVGYMVAIYGIARGLSEILKVARGK